MGASEEQHKAYSTRSHESATTGVQGEEEEGEVRREE